jgi:predicted GIY-YIG superfamily endonuclease
MFYSYIIKSEDGNHRYIGHCKNLKSQLNQHNSRNVKATRDNRPWKIIYSEKFKTEKDAIFQERFYKTTEGQDWLLEKGY